MQLVCVGDNVADYYHKKDKYYVGGSAYNVSVLSNRLGLETAYIGTFGTDENGQYLVDFLKKEEVDISHISIKEGINAFSEVKEIKGKSEIIKVDKGVYKSFSLSKKDLDYIANFDLLHTTLYSYTEKYLPFFKESGLKVSFDFSFSREKNYIEKNIPYIDIAFFSAEGEDIDKLKKEMAKIYKLGVTYVIFTLGNEGVLALYDDEYFYQKVKEVEVIDSLGAGDAFISKFLTEIINKEKKNKKEVKKILTKSVNFAAKNCTHYGTIAKRDKLGGNYKNE